MFLMEEFMVMEKCFWDKKEKADFRRPSPASPTRTIHLRKTGLPYYTKSKKFVKS
jgi:hypothetical protein